MASEVNLFAKWLGRRTDTRALRGFETGRHTTLSPPRLSLSEDSGRALQNVAVLKSNAECALIVGTIMIRRLLSSRL